MHRFGNCLCLGHRGRVKRILPPGYIQWQASKVDDASVAAIATQIVGRSHLEAFCHTRFGTESAQQALGIVDNVPRYLEAFPALDFLPANIDTVNGAVLGTSSAGRAFGQIVAMESPVAFGHDKRQLRILVLFGERPSLGVVGSAPVSHRDPECFGNADYGEEYIAKPPVKRTTCPGIIGPHRLFSQIWDCRVSVGQSLGGRSAPKPSACNGFLTPLLYGRGVGPQELGRNLWHGLLVSRDFAE
jgi:hypothetical protein